MLGEYGSRGMQLPWGIVLREYWAWGNTIPHGGVYKDIYFYDNGGMYVDVGI